MNKFEFCEVRIKGFYDSSKIVGELNGLPINIYHSFNKEGSFNKIPYINPYFVYDLNLKEYSENTYGVELFNGMYDEPTDMLLELRDVIDPNNLMESMEYFENNKEQLGIGKEEIYCIFFPYRLKLIKYLSNEYHYLTKVDNFTMAKYYDRFVLLKDDLIKSLKKYGPEYFKNFKLRISNFSSEQTKKLAGWINLSVAALDGIFCKPNGEYSRYLKNKLKNFKINNVAYLYKYKKDFDDLTGIDYGNFKIDRGLNKIHVWEPYRVSIFDLINLNVNENFELVFHSVFYPSDRLISVDFDCFQLFRGKIEGIPKADHRKIPIINEIKELVDKKYSVILYKFNNNYLKDLYLQELNKLKNISETWEGYIHTSYQLERLTGYVFKSLTDEYGLKRGKLYICNEFGSKIKLTEINKGILSSGVVLNNIQSIKPILKINSFVSVRQFSVDYFHNLSIIVGSDIDYTKLKNVGIQLNQLKLFK